MTWTVQAVREEIAAGRVTRTSIVEEALERAAAGVGPIAFTKLYAEEALRTARLQDADATLAGGDLSGVTVSIKDLFDVEGQVTTAGSTVLQSAPPAKQDAPAVAYLKNAGAILVGRTNMTEFAYSGVGMNPHYGTPPNPYDRITRRIAGGSTSGGAVSVSDGMAVAALGSDTGGSVRIPAALCGLTGYKPTKGDISTQGMFPLSPTLDSVGVIANTVRCCHAMNSALREQRHQPLEMQSLSSAVYALPTHYFTDGMDAAVAATFDRSLSALSQRGVRFVKVELPELSRMQQLNANGGFAAAEAFRFHQQLRLDMGGYDPRVRERILRGSTITNADYAGMVKERRAILASFARQNIHDGLLSPTVPLIAPPISELADDAVFHRINLLLLRNPSVANFLDLCSISLPCHWPGEPPVGLMILGRTGSDAQLLSHALAMEDMFLGQ